MCGDVKNLWNNPPPPPLGQSPKRRQDHISVICSRVQCVMLPRFNIISQNYEKQKKAGVFVNISCKGVFMQNSVALLAE